ncbi:hypothetical protein [Luethyella okanaganae]|uniref:Bacitracin resistance protein n=1 Tax=Luethyella okanaganae TaxID=69372 RepID=A0ABW1VDF4_9MICO
MSTHETMMDATSGTRRTPLWLATTIAVFFGLSYAYDVWEAVGNLVGLSSLASGLGTTLSVFGWIVLVFALVLPIILFGLAFWLGRSRGVLAQAALYLVGLGVSATLYLDVYSVFGPGSLLA